MNFEMAKYMTLGYSISDQGNLAHAENENKRRKKKKGYKEFVYYFPYLGLVACIFCSFGGAFYAIETNVLQENIIMGYQQVCHSPYAYPYVGNFLIICKSLGGLVVGLSILIFFSGLAIRLANFKDSVHPSRTPSMVFLIFIYPAFPIWTVLFGRCM